MSGAAPQRLHRGDPHYPESLAVLGEAAPEPLFVLGDPALLRLPLLGLFCSVRVPGELVLAGVDAGRRLRAAGVPTLGGFHSPLERELLDWLLRGPAPVVVCPARALHGGRLPARWRRALDERRLLLVSPFERRRRAGAERALARNRLVAALARRVLVLHASPGGRLLRLTDEIVAWGRPVLCLDSAANRELLLRGATPVRPEELGSRE